MVSHLSGIRHYDKKKEEVIDIDEKAATEGNTNKEQAGASDNGKKDKEKENGIQDTEFKEFYLNQKFESVGKALQLFKDDQLLSKPGIVTCTFPCLHFRKIFFFFTFFCNVVTTRTTRHRKAIQSLPPPEFLYTKKIIFFIFTHLFEAGSLRAQLKD